MADFPATDFIQLTGVSEVTDGSGTRLTWTGQTNDSRDFTVNDVGNDGILTEDSDTFSFISSTYSGWYITIDGRDYGIFHTSFGGVSVIPYDMSLHNLGYGIPIAAEIQSGSTNQFDATLETAANCFLTGTRIATPDGERPIETLGPGDTVLTADGAVAPVLWVWRQDITNVFGLGDARAPVRIAANALGDGCPSRDLIVTADHALMLDGVLVNAGALVNGSSIAAIPLATLPARFSYWHVETEDHTVLLAENCPAESFIDYRSRDGFDNHAAYLECVGSDRIIPEMPVPRISTQRLLLPTLRRRLGIDRAA